MSSASPKKARTAALVFTLKCDGAVFTIDETHIAKVPELVRKTEGRTESCTITVTDVNPVFLAAVVEYCRSGVLPTVTPAMYRTAVEWGIVKAPTDEFQLQLAGIREGLSSESEFWVNARAFIERVYNTCADNMNFNSPRGATIIVPCKQYVEHDMYKAGVDAYKYAVAHPDLFRTIAFTEYGLRIEFSDVFSGKVHKGKDGEGVHKELDPTLLENGDTLFTSQPWLATAGSHHSDDHRFYTLCTTMVVAKPETVSTTYMGPDMGVTHEFETKGVKVQLTYSCGRLSVTRMRSEKLTAISLAVYPLANAEEVQEWQKRAPERNLYASDFADLYDADFTFKGGDCLLEFSYMIHEDVKSEYYGSPYALGIAVMPSDIFYKDEKVLESNAHYVTEDNMVVSMVKMTVHLMNM